MTVTIHDIIGRGSRQVDLACAEVAKTDEHRKLMDDYNAYRRQVKDALPEELRDTLAEMELTDEQAAELCYHACYLAGVADGFSMRRAVVEG